MNTDMFKGKWNQLRGDAKSKWGDLTDDELDQMEGDRDKMVGIIQEKYGKGREEAEKEVDDFLNQH